VSISLRGLFSLYIYHKLYDTEGPSSSRVTHPKNASLLNLAVRPYSGREASLQRAARPQRLSFLHRFYGINFAYCIRTLLSIKRPKLLSIVRGYSFYQILIFDVALYLTVFSSDSGPANFNFSIHRQPVTKESRYSRVADCRLIAATVVPFAPRIAWCPTNHIREHSGMTHHAVTVGLVKLNGYLG